MTISHPTHPQPPTQYSSSSPCCRPSTVSLSGLCRRPRTAPSTPPPSSSPTNTVSSISASTTSVLSSQTSMRRGKSVSDTLRTTSGRGVGPSAARGYGFWASGERPLPGLRSSRSGCGVNLSSRAGERRRNRSKREANVCVKILGMGVGSFWDGRD